MLRFEAGSNIIQFNTTNSSIELFEICLPAGRQVVFDIGSITSEASLCRMSQRKDIQERDRERGERRLNSKLLIYQSAKIADHQLCHT